jgi:hypothetical protein
VATKGKKGIYAYIVLVSLALLGLAGLRFYSLYLEHELMALNQQIEALQQKDLLLSQRLLSMMAPDRVVYYASGKLGMTKSLERDSTIRLAIAPDSERFQGDNLPTVALEKRKTFGIFSAFASAKEDRED